MASRDSENFLARIVSLLVWPLSKRMQKRLVCSLVALTVPVLLAGCGSANGSLNPQASTSSPSIAGTDGSGGSTGSTGTGSTGTGSTGTGSTGTGSTG
ncbi:MAG: hypothetical protein WA700_11350, partial [Acidobacteriaceae bacterium]